MLKACLRHKIKKVVYVGTTAYIGGSEDASLSRDEQGLESMETLKKQPYAYSKYLGQNMVDTYSDSIDICSALPGVITGPGDLGNMRKFFSYVKKSRILFSTPGGISLVDVRDAAKALILLKNRGRPGQKYIVSNTNILLAGLLHKIARTLEKGVKVITMPRAVYMPAYLFGAGLEYVFPGSPITSEIVSKGFKYRYYSAEKIKKELRWNPSYSLDKTLKDMV